jgi:hypothetical protein
MITLRLGDCVERMSQMPEGSVDAIVCDPPYGLEFMGKTWDKIGDVSRANRGTLKNWKRPPNEASKAPKFRTNAPAFDLSTASSRAMGDWHALWLAEAFRVLTSSGVVKAFGGTRTFHRLAAAMEDAGFVDIHLEAWGYGSGFPKSMDVSKALESGGGRPEDIRRMQLGGSYCPSGRGRVNYDHGAGSVMEGKKVNWEPSTPEGIQWNGWGTALKPAWEPVVVGRKPQ